MLKLTCLALSVIALAMGSTVGSAETATAPDPRVEQNVTYSAKHRAVLQIVADLEAQTGIKLYAGSSASDWQVRSRRMNVFVKDLKLSELMASIERVMKFHWSRDDKADPPTYRLIVDRQAVIAADAQKAKGDKMKEELWRKRRQAWIDAMDQYGAWSDAQIRTLRHKDIIVYDAAQSGSLRAIHALFSEVPEAKERFLQGRRFRVPSSKLNPNTKSLIYQSGNNFSKYVQMKFKEEVIGYGDGFKPEEEFDFAFSRFDVDTFSPDSHWGDPSEGRVGLFCMVRGRVESLVADFPQRDSVWDKARIRAHIDILDGVEPDEAWNVAHASAPDFDAKRRSDEELLYPSEPLIDHSTPAPDLEKTVKLEIEKPKADQLPAMAVCDYIAAFEEALAKATGMGVVSDSWVNIQANPLPGEEKKIADLLESFSKLYNYNWDTHSGVLEFRHRKWWKNRLNQIADELVAAWSDSTRKGDTMSVGTLADISTLTFDQAEESLKTDKVLGIAGVYDQLVKSLDYDGNAMWLRFYASLSPQLRPMLSPEGDHPGVSGHMLTPEQWKLAENLFDRICYDPGDARFTLVLTDNSRNEIAARFIAIDDATGEEYHRWQATLPKYVPPKAANDPRQQERGP